MTRRHNYYEAAFEAFLRHHRIPYVAVDETRRTLEGGGTLKSLDFIVSPVGAGRSWLIDIKGRRFPTGAAKHYWKNWTNGDELESLARWEQLFGERFQGLFVFAYDLVADRSPLPEEEIFEHHGRRFAFVAIQLDLYLAWAKLRSPKWNTFHIPVEAFRRLARSTRQLLLSPPAVRRTDFSG